MHDVHKKSKGDSHRREGRRRMLATGVLFSSHVLMVVVVVESKSTSSPLYKGLRIGASGASTTPSSSLLLRREKSPLAKDEKDEDGLPVDAII
jgi:hypothetical protein